MGKILSITAIYGRHTRTRRHLYTKRNADQGHTSVPIHAKRIGYRWAAFITHPRMNHAKPIETTKFLSCLGFSLAKEMIRVECARDAADAG